MSAAPALPDLSSSGCARLRVRAFDRLVTGDGPFGVVECAACQYGVTVPQLSGDELAPYYADSYYEDFYEHTGGSGGNPLQRLRELLRRRGAERRQRRPPFQPDGLAPGSVLEVGLRAPASCWPSSPRAVGRPTGSTPAPPPPLPPPAAAPASTRGRWTTSPGRRAASSWSASQHSLEHIPCSGRGGAQGERAAGAGRRPDRRRPQLDELAAAAFFGNRWFVLDMPRHLQHFSPRALPGSLSGSGSRPGRGDDLERDLHRLQRPPPDRRALAPGWKLWLSFYALSLSSRCRLVLLGDRVGGGDAAMP